MTVSIDAGTNPGAKSRRGLLFAVVAILGTPGCLVGSGRVKSRGPWGHSTMTIKGSNGNNRHFIRAADGAWMPVKGLDAAKASRVVPINDSKATTEFLFRPNRLALEAAKDAQAKEVSASFFSESSKQSNKKSNPKAWPLEARIMTPVTLANRVYQASGAILETARPSTWPAYQVGYRYINLLSNVSPILARYAIDLPGGDSTVSVVATMDKRKISVAAATTFPHPAQARVFAKKIQDDGTLEGGIYAVARGNTVIFGSDLQIIRQAGPRLISLQALSAASPVVIQVDLDLELLESETGLTPDRLAATVQHQLHHLHQSHGRGQGLGTGFIGVASIRRALAVVQREHRTQVALKTDLTAKGDLYATIALTGKNVNRQLVRPGVAQGTPTKSSVSQDRLKGVDASLEFSASTSIPTVVEQLGPTESFIFLSGTDHPNPTDMPSSLVFDESPATCALSRA